MMPIAAARFAVTTLSTRQTIFLVVLFVATSLTFIQLDSRHAFDPVKDAVRTLIAPVVSVAGNAGGRGDLELERELSAVKAERDQLAAENAHLKAEVREVDQLRMQAKLQQDRPTWKMLQARVQAPDPTNQQKFLTIDKGSRNGVTVGMAVVAQGPNYIGQVTEVWESSARVMLIIDVSQRVGAQLESGGDGVIFGAWQSGGRVELRYLDRDAVPKPGELVLTTDSPALRTARVPGGLIVGRVGDAPPDSSQGDTQTIPVIPLVAFEKLEVVTVVLVAHGRALDVMAYHAEEPCGAWAGFKLARYRASALPRNDDALIEAIRVRYAAATSLPWDDNITRGMSGYYAYNQRLYRSVISPRTPAAIIELGFLTNPADRNLLVTQQPTVAKALADGIITFLTAR